MIMPYCGPPGWAQEGLDTINGPVEPSWGSDANQSARTVTSQDCSLERWPPRNTGLLSLLRRVWSHWKSCHCYTGLLSGWPRTHKNNKWICRVNVSQCCWSYRNRASLFAVVWGRKWRHLILSGTEFPLTNPATQIAKKHTRHTEIPPSWHLTGFIGRRHSWGGKVSPNVFSGFLS